jgi:hypothetical protein
VQTLDKGMRREYKGMRREWRHLHAPAPGALLAHEANPNTSGVAHVYARRLDQIAQHAAPRLLALGGTSAHEPARLLNTRVALQNSRRQLHVAQGQQQKLHSAPVERAGAGGAGGRRNLVL